jgi:hypothetical protein
MVGVDNLAVIIVVVVRHDAGAAACTFLVVFEVPIVFEVTCTDRNTQRSPMSRVG